MKTILAFCVLLLTLTAGAVDLTLTWDDPNPTGSITEYRVYQQAAGSDVWVLVASPTLTRVTLTDLDPGTYQIAISAVSINQFESDRSTPFVVAKPLSPINIRVVIP